MHDIDFDEIDKAVNSALKRRIEDSSSRYKQEVDEEKPKINLGEPIVEFEEPDVELSRDRQVPVFHRKPAGKFMDMVHPSSDMRKLVHSDIKPEPPVDLPKPGPIVTAAVNPPVPVIQPEVKPVPPIVNDIIPPAPTPVEPPKPIETPPPPPAAQPESPFLADAKVEKRPLGAVVSPEPADSIEDVNLEDLPEEDYTKKIGHYDSSLPPELQEDLLRIESGGHTTELLNGNDEQDNKKSDKKPKKDKKQPEAQPVPAAVPATASIFDTKDYHKPVLVGAKKKPGWPKVLMIVLLALGGAGGGLAVYFLYFAGK